MKKPYSSVYLLIFVMALLSGCSSSNAPIGLRSVQISKQPAGNGWADLNVQLAIVNTNQDKWQRFDLQAVDVWTKDPFLYRIDRDDRTGSQLDEAWS